MEHDPGNKFNLFRPNVKALARMAPICTSGPSGPIAKPEDTAVMVDATVTKKVDSLMN